MRTLVFSLIVFLVDPVLAADAVLVGVNAKGQSVELDDATKAQCSITEVQGTYEAGVHEIEAIDCLASVEGPFGGVRYERSVKATRKNKGDAVFICTRGCNKNAPKQIKYVPINAGC
jgi:hypothetical protein